jgi:hypothetical protein
MRAIESVYIGPLKDGKAHTDIMKNLKGLMIFDRG